MATLTSSIENAVNVPQLIREALNNVKKTMESNMSRHHRNASRKSVGSLRATGNGVEGILWGYTSFWSMETGRKAGKTPYKFSDIIYQWMLAKGIRPPKPKSVAFLIARKIKLSGTRLHRNHGFDDIFTSAIDEETEKLNEKIMTRLGSSVTYINQNFANPL